MALDEYKVGEGGAFLVNMGVCLPSSKLIQPCKIIPRRKEERKDRQKEEGRKEEHIVRAASSPPSFVIVVVDYQSQASTDGTLVETEPRAGSFPQCPGYVGVLPDQLCSPASVPSVLQRQQAIFEKQRKQS